MAIFARIRSYGLLGSGVDWRSEERLLHGGLRFSRRVGGHKLEGHAGESEAVADFVYY